MATSTTENDTGLIKHSKTPKSVLIYKRPQWPYEDWSYVPKQDPAANVVDQSDEETSKENSWKGITAPIADTCDKTHESPCNEVSSKSCPGKEKIDEDDKICYGMSLEDFSDVYAPDHWFDDNLFEDVSDDLPMSRLLAYMQSMLLKNEDGDTKEIADSMNKMMNDVAAKVASSYDVFKDCYVIPVGSVVENTKIEKADEFDFAVVLPVFEKVDGLFDVLFEKDEEKMLNDPNLRAYAKDMLNDDGDVTEAVEHFQALMKQIWSFYMEDFAPEGWTVSETFCYGDEISIAGTFHLKRSSDGFNVDVDLCFLAPIHEDALRKSVHKIIEQKEFILENCLDKDNKVYALLLKDHDINYSVNTVRFSMSVKERELLNRYGDENGRIKCYKFSKCIAKLFLPKTSKRQDCDRCLEPMVSSFCLKNIVLYMMHNYPSDAKWTKEQIANRVIEVFQILNFSLKVNCGIVSAYFLPYMITATSDFMYDPEKRSVAGKGIEWGDVTPVPCVLPDLDKVVDFFGKDQISRQILENYREFLSQSRWSSLEVIDRLVEVLGTLREPCEESRKEIAENPGSTCFQLNAGADISGFLQVNVDNAM